MSFTPDPFDTAVFASLTARRSARGSSAPGNPDAPERQQVDLNALIHESMLDFTSFAAADKTARIHAFERGYRVTFGNQRFAFDMGSFRSLLEADNDSVDLAFSDDLLNYAPDEGLVRKSKIPLWLIKPLGGNVVLLERAW